LKDARYTGVLIELRGVKDFGALSSMSETTQIEGQQALLELNSIIIVNALVLNVIYIIYGISLIKNDYLFYSKIYVVFPL
jgi:hypothetical protein